MIQADMRWRCEKNVEKMWKKWDYQWDYQWDYPWDYPSLIYFTGKINMKNEHVHQPINMWFPLLVQRWINENSSEKMGLSNSHPFHSTIFSVFFKAFWTSIYSDFGMFEWHFWGKWSEHVWTFWKHPTFGLSRQATCFILVHAKLNL